MSYQALGPGVLLYGDPTVALGAGMFNLGDHENVTLNLGISTAYTTSANTGDSAIASSLRARPPAPELQTELYDSDLAILEKIVLGGTLTTVAGPPDKKAFGIGGSVKNITPKTLVFIPEGEKAAGIEAAHAIWIPAAFVANLDQSRYGRLSDSANNNPFTVTWRAARQVEDQSEDPIPENAQFLFFGSPTALGLTWLLPAL